MKIAVIGGSRGTGAQVAQQIVAGGDECVVVSRSGTAPAGSKAMSADATDADAVSSAIAGCDAVVVTVGGGDNGHRARVTRAVIAAMAKAGVSRLVVQSSVGAGDSAKHLPIALRFLMKIVLAKPLADHNEQEAAVRDSGLEWTIVRPSGLKDEPATGHIRVLDESDEGTVRGTITREDLGLFIYESISDSTLVHSSVSVSNG